MLVATIAGPPDVSDTSNEFAVMFAAEPYYASCENGAGSEPEDVKPTLSPAERGWLGQPIVADPFVIVTVEVVIVWSASNFRMTCVLSRSDVRPSKAAE